MNLKINIIRVKVQGVSSDLSQSMELIVGTSNFHLLFIPLALTQYTGYKDRISHSACCNLPGVIVHTTADDLNYARTTRGVSIGQFGPFELFNGSFTLRSPVVLVDNSSLFVFELRWKVTWVHIEI